MTANLTALEHGDVILLRDGTAHVVSRIDTINFYSWGIYTHSDRATKKDFAYRNNEIHDNCGYIEGYGNEQPGDIVAILTRKG